MNIQEAINIVAQASAMAQLNKQSHIQVDQALMAIQAYVADKEKPAEETPKKEKK
jgi:hypothetical protein